MKPTLQPVRVETIETRVDRPATVVQSDSAPDPAPASPSTVPATPTVMADGLAETQQDLSRLQTRPEGTTLEQEFRSYADASGEYDNLWDTDDVLPEPRSVVVVRTQTAATGAARQEWWVRTLGAQTNELGDTHHKRSERQTRRKPLSRRQRKVLRRQRGGNAKR